MTPVRKSDHATIHAGWKEFILPYRDYATQEGLMRGLDHKDTAMKVIGRDYAAGPVRRDRFSPSRDASCPDGQKI